MILALGASPASASVVWTAGAEGPLSSDWASGDAYDVNSGAGTATTNAAWASSTRVMQVASPTAIGAKAYAMTVLAGDQDKYTTGAQRTELGQSNPTAPGVNREMVQGDERWVALQLLIPANYPTATTWAEFAQFKGEGAGNGPFQVSFKNGKLSLEKSMSQTYGTTNDIVAAWTSPAATVRGQWIKLLLHVNWSTAADGFYELWGDLADGAGFHRLRALTPGWTLKFNASGAPNPVGARIGIYRQTVAQDSTVYYDGYTVATSQYDAMVSAFGFPPTPTASFAATPSTGPAPLGVQFTDTSTQQPTSWAWDFGDGTTSTTQNPIHTFTAAGTYTARLTATNGAGSDTASQTITVNVPAPTAGFTASTTSGTAPLSVQFSDTSSQQPTGWSWDFGDGATSSAQNPAHTYTAAGTYTATLTATNTGGSNTTSQTITVNVPAPAPTAGFTASPTSGTAPLSVQFSDSSTGSPTSWAWDFGDGATSSAQSPAHTYTAAGTYTATLTASNAAGTSSPVSRTITVTNPPPAIKRESVSTLLTSAAVGTRTIAKPSGTAAGDVLVSCLTLTSGSVTAAPVGWTRFAAVTGAASPKVYGYYKVATGSESASYSWTTSSVTGSAGIARYSGARVLDGAATHAWSNATVSAATVPGVKTTTPNVMLVGCMGTNSASAGITAPSGLAQAWELGVRASELDDGLQPAAVAAGAKTWTFSTRRAWAGWVVGLRP